MTGPNEPEEQEYLHDHDFDDGFNEDALWERHMHDEQEKRDGWQPEEAR